MKRFHFQNNIGITPQNDGESNTFEAANTNWRFINNQNHGEQTKVVIRNARKQNDKRDYEKDGLSEDIGKAENLFSN